MEKPEKICLNNANLCHSLAEGRVPDRGALGETLLLSMLLAGQAVSVPARKPATGIGFPFGSSVFSIELANFLNTQEKGRLKPWEATNPSCQG